MGVLKIFIGCLERGFGDSDILPCKGFDIGSRTNLPFPDVTFVVPGMVVLNAKDSSFKVSFFIYKS